MLDIFFKLEKNVAGYFVLNYLKKLNTSYKKKGEQKLSLSVSNILNFIRS